VILAGEIDISVAAEAQQAIVGALTADPPNHVDVDLTQLSFVDSRGLSALIAGRRVADEHGRQYRVLNARGAVLRTLQITALLPFLNATSG
jgi:anti-anti-sigma factor